jgi:putative N-acetylmannosamine-6-phosphate epimerase
MRFPLDMRAFKDLIHDWISDVVRDEGIKVVWREQDAPQPPLPYVGLKIISGPIPLSQSWGQLEEVDLTRAGKEIEMSTYVQSELTVSCQAYVDRKFAVETEIDALAILAACRASLSLESTKQKLFQSRIGFVRSEPLLDLSVLEETSTPSRANIDLVFGAMLTYTEYVTYIQKVEIKSPQFGIDDIVEV